MTTHGLSPKMTWPTVALVALGVVALIVGALLHDATLTTVGIALIGASGVTGALGYRAPAGEIRFDGDPDANGAATEDYRLGPESGQALYGALLVLVVVVIVLLVIGWR